MPCPFQGVNLVSLFLGELLVSSHMCSFDWQVWGTESLPQLPHQTICQSCTYELNSRKDFKAEWARIFSKRNPLYLLRLFMLSWVSPCVKKAGFSMKNRVFSSVINEYLRTVSKVSPNFAERFEQDALCPPRAVISCNCKVYTDGSNLPACRAGFMLRGIARQSTHDWFGV